ncbi:unnamed protein product [Prunus armeniaca]
MQDSTKKSCGLAKQSPGWIVSPGRLCQKFGRMSQFLVSGPSIGVMSETRRDLSGFPRNFRVGPVIHSFKLGSNLVDDELRVAIYVELFDTHVFGQRKAY